MKHSSTSISLCLIVRDEEASLGPCLASFKGSYDELIVVDTGSSDRTVDIAETFGARVEFFPWRDDFSAARNYACSLAQGDWVVMADADELLAPDGIGPSLPEMLAQIPDRVDKLLIEHQTRLESQTVSLLVDRIFRRSSGLRWKYRVHEVLETPVKKTARTQDFHLVHNNAGKPRGKAFITPEKEAMYLRALSLDMEDFPDDPRPAFYFAATLYGAGRFKEALQAYEHYFSLSENQEPVRRAVAFRDAAAVAGSLGSSARRRQLLFSSLEHDWRSAETYHALSNLALENGNLDEAIHWLQIETTCPINDAGLYWTSAAAGPNLWMQLAELYRQRGDTRAAQDCMRKAGLDLSRAPV